MFKVTIKRPKPKFLSEGEFKKLKLNPGYEVNQLGEVINSKNSKALKQVKNTFTPLVILPVDKAIWMEEAEDCRYLFAHIPTAVLVLQTFIGPKPEGYTFGFKDGDPTNVRASNLIWCKNELAKSHGHDRIYRGKQARHAKRGPKKRDRTPEYVAILRLFRDDLIKRYGAEVKMCEHIWTLPDVHALVRDGRTTYQLRSLLTGLKEMRMLVQVDVRNRRAGRAELGYRFDETYLDEQDVWRHIFQDDTMEAEEYGFDEKFMDTTSDKRIVYGLGVVQREVHKFSATELAALLPDIPYKDEDKYDIGNILPQFGTDIGIEDDEDLEELL